MSFRVICIALLTFVYGAGLAQKSEIDSLESLVNSVPSDTNKVWLLNRLVGALREKDNNRALIFAQQAAELAELLNYKKGLSHALENYGWILYRRADYSKSLDISTKALKVSEEIGDKAAIARCQINIAAIYYEQKQFIEAIGNFRKAYASAATIPHYGIMGRCFNNIAYTYVGMNQLDSAFWYVQQALLISEKSGEPYMIAFSRRTLGDIYEARNERTEALKNYQECLDLSKQHANTFLKASVLHRLGKTHSELGNYDLALKYLHENLQVAIQFGFKDELERAYITLADVYHKTGNIKKAYEMQTAYIGLHDSLYNQRSSEQIALMQIRFDTELKQAQIELLTKDAALQAEEISKQRIWIYFYVGCLSLLLILAFVLFYNNRHDRRAKLALEEKNKAIEIQAQQLRNLNATKDKLFSIISHDLRSPLASLRALVDIVGTSGLTQNEFVDVTRSLKRNLDSVYDDLDNLLLWAQTQLRGLQASPEEIDLFKLVEEKIRLFDEPASAKSVVITNSIVPGTQVFADPNHVSLIFRNLLANAVKYNQRGGRIYVSSQERGDYYEIEVSDSGIGMSVDDVSRLFNPETHFTTPGTNKEKGAGIGLLLTKEFVESNQGAIRVKSQLGKGTSFIFTLRAVRQTVLA